MMADIPAFRHFAESIVNPYFITLLLFALSLLLLCIRGDSRGVRAGLLLSLIGFLVLSTGWLPMVLTNKLENQHPVVEEVNPAIQWVVVLSGGQAVRDDLPVNNLLYSASIKRLVEGVRLYRQLPAAKLLLSGGTYDGKMTEASQLAMLASWFGIPSRDVVLETDSINTADQAVAIKKILGNKPFYLVTSAIHMPRALAFCRQQGLTPIAAPTDFTYYWDDERWEKTYLPNPKNPVYVNIAWHEILGRAWAWLLKNR